jgi:prepilin-type N-terminal cleavage/methylation domain-containing protein
MKNNHTRGYTLVELIVAIGLFAMIMVLASGAYLVMINASRQAQGTAAGIDNLSFALETMTRTIRTGASYSCGIAEEDCDGGTSFSVTNGGKKTAYAWDGSAITQSQDDGDAKSLIDSAVKIESLKFYAVGTKSFSETGDKRQARVTIVVKGEVSSGPGKFLPFTVETSATMRGTDI